MSRLRALAPPTLRGRLALVATLTSLLVLGVVVISVIAAFASRERAATDRALATAAARIAGAAGLALQAPPGAIPPEVARQATGLLTDGATGARLLRGSGVVVDDGVLPRGAPRTLGYRSYAGWRLLTRAVEDGALVQVGTPEAAAQDRIARVRTIAVTAGAIGLLACAGLVYWISGLALRPLARLREGAARVSSTRDLTARLPAVEGPDEADDLARSLNAMLARLEASAAQTEAALAAARRFTADAGHELRTPLTSLRTNLDTLARNPDLPEEERLRVLEELMADEARLARLLEGLQALARGDAGARGESHRVDLADVADAAVVAARRRHPGLVIELGEDGPPPPHVRGVEEALRAIADNLLENAARHGGGGRVEVCVRDGDGRVRLVVDDDGPGIPPEERERVLARFARGSGARAPGSGLGLAIVAQQAALHGGTVRIEDAPLGGARVVVELPAA